MRHLFQNRDGETIAADTLDQAARYHDCELGDWDEPLSGWRQLPDDEELPVYDDRSDSFTTKSSREWAEECNQPTIVASTYWGTTARETERLALNSQIGVRRMAADLIELAADFRCRAESCQAIAESYAYDSSSWARCRGKALAYRHCAELLEAQFTAAEQHESETE